MFERSRVSGIPLRGFFVEADTYMAKRGKKKRGIRAVWLFLFLLAAGAGAFLMYRRSEKLKNARETAGNDYRETAAWRGAIRETITGSGVLSRDDSVDVVIPTGYKIDRIMVETGDPVTVGQALASVDLNSLRSAIADVQSSISSVDEELGGLGEDSDDKTVRSPIAGRVKAIYIEPGEEAGDIVRSRGSLMLLSTDGLMQVLLPANADIRPGERCTVAEDGGASYEGVAGTVTQDVLVVTIPDDEALPGTAVQVTRSADGTLLGSGELSVHAPWQVTEMSGTAGEIYVSVNEKISADGRLLRLNNVKDTAKQEELLAKREDLTKALGIMLAIEKDGVIRSDFSGTVTAILVTEGEPVTKQAGTVQDGSFQNQGSLYGNYAGMFSQTASEGTAGTIKRKKSAGSLTYQSRGKGRFLRLSDVPAEVETPAAAEVPAEGEIPAVPIGQVGIPLRIPSADNQMGTSELAAAFDNDAARIENLSWSLDGTECTARVTIAAKDGYVFQSDVQPLVNGGNAYVSENSGSRIVVTVNYQVGPPSQEAGDGTPAGETESGTDAAGQVPSDPSSDPQPSAQPGGDPQPSGQIPGDTQIPSQTSGDTQTGQNLPSGLPSGIPLPGGDTGETTLPGGVTIPDGVNPSDYGSFSLPGSISIGNLGSMGSIGAFSYPGYSLPQGLGDYSGMDTQAGLAGDAAVLYSAYETAGFKVAPDTDMKLIINVDELDILSVAEGQAAEIELDALEGELFTGTVTSVSREGVNTGGSTKYAVTLTVLRDERMLTGMSATATVTVREEENALIVPADALGEDTEGTYVWTSLGDDGKLSGKKRVKTGLSTEEQVEILEGLEDGESVWYEELPGDEILGNPFGYGSMGRYT